MEKVYKTMSQAGVFNLIVGICLAAIGVFCCVSGSFTIVHGVKLLKQKKKILF